MLANDVQVTERMISPRVAVLDISGDVNAAAETALGNAHSQVSGQGARVVILNFAGLKYMNSTGIGLLVTLLIRASRQQQRLMAYGLNDHYRQIFKLTRLDEAIALYDSETQAISAAGGAN